MMGRAHQSDFYEEDGNQYFLTKFKSNELDRESGSKRGRPISGIKEKVDAKASLGSEGAGH